MTEERRDFWKEWDEEKDHQGFDIYDHDYDTDKGLRMSWMHELFDYCEGLEKDNESLSIRMRAIADDQVKLDKLLYERTKEKDMMEKAKNCLEIRYDDEHKSRRMERDHFTQGIEKVKDERDSYKEKYEEVLAQVKFGDKCEEKDGIMIKELEKKLEETTNEGLNWLEERDHWCYMYIGLEEQLEQAQSENETLREYSSSLERSGCEHLTTIDNLKKELDRVKIQRDNLAGLIQNVWVDKNMEMGGE